MRKRVDAVLVISLVLSDEEFDALDALGEPVGVARPRARAASSPSASTTSHGARLAVEHLSRSGTGASA